ncbi:MAG TPA: hypothetical protein VFR86_15505 [Burkholderiaceae bacterium]|nr:hypothetical protein [Burkholderiaceae bacterium]
MPSDHTHEAERGGFFARRWRGEAPLPIVFWRDMIVVGTLINLVTGLAAFMLLAQAASVAPAIAVYFAPVPYNLFLCLAVWRAPRRSAFHAVVAGIWFVAMLVL